MLVFWILTVLFSGELSNFTPVAPFIEVLIRPTSHSSCVFSKRLQIYKDKWRKSLSTEVFLCERWKCVGHLWECMYRPCKSNSGKTKIECLSISMQYQIWWYQHCNCFHWAPLDKSFETKHNFSRSNSSKDQLFLHQQHEIF